MKNIKTDTEDWLLIGIGNSGRSDDGLGWQFLERAAEMCIQHADFEFRYQLQVEDVLLICPYPHIIFIDATHDNVPGGFEMKPCTPAAHYFFSSHTQSPETILYLADELYRHRPKAWTLAISGYKWDIGFGLSAEAEQNLERALKWFVCKDFDFSVLSKENDIQPRR